MEKKFKLTDDTISFQGYTLYRIEALKDFADVKKGDKGGFVESEDNLSQDWECWIYDDAKVYGNARVSGNAKVYGKAEVCGDARVYGKAEVCGDAKISSNRDYIVFKNWWSSGRYFTWTRSNNRWIVGCFYGTGEELVVKAYKDSEESGREYERIVNYVNSILKDEQEKKKNYLLSLLHKLLSW